ncbi:MAG: hypothetical protein ACYCW6_27875 [Candidatus Xenobia bacterium]
MFEFDDRITHRPPLPVAPSAPRLEAGPRLPQDAVVPGRPLEPLARAPHLEQPGAHQAAAQAAQAQQTDDLAAQQVWFAMVIQRREAQQRMLAMLADLQTSILAIWEDVMVRRQKAVEKMMEAWAKVMQGS